MNANGVANSPTTPNSPTVVARKNNYSTSSAITAPSANASNRQKVVTNRDCHYSGYPKPAYSNACLIALGNIEFFVKKSLINIIVLIDKL